MSRRRKPQDEVIGQDSFLDVVANLVGILIILIMVVGARAKDAMLHSEPTPNEEPAAVVSVAAKELEAAKSAEQQVEQDIHRISGEIQQQQVEISYRGSERDRVQLLITAAEQSLAAKRDELSESQKREFDERNALAAAKSELAELEQGVAFLESAKPQTTILEHLPTPMAKTVFGQELHLRLHAGRVSHIPWDDFIQLLKEDAPRKAWRLKDQSELTERVGPVGGFWMQYTLKREVQTVATKVGMAMQQSVVLDRFTLQPESELFGEPVDQALQPSSEFLALLRTRRPDSTTITVWTYPDSFNQFRQLKQELFKVGYVTAARPLPADHPIGGSPEGTRSAAQ